MPYHLYLPGGFPAWARKDDPEAIEHLKRHPLLGVYEDFQGVIEAYDQAKRQALERIWRTGRPNLEAADVRRLTQVRLHLVTPARPR